MFIETKQITTRYTKNSQLGRTHTYTRKKTMVVLSCDNCAITFERELGKMDRQRLSNTYYHVCPNCNPKQFAQKRGVERRKLWDLPVDSEIDIGRI